LEIVLSNLAWNDVGLVTVNKLLDLKHGLGRIEECLRQTEMPVEFDIVFWYNHTEPLLRFLDFYEFQNLEVIIVDFVGQRERANINDINIWILDAKNSRNLSVLLLFELFD